MYYYINFYKEKINNYSKKLHKTQPNFRCSIKRIDQEKNRKIIKKDKIYKLKVIFLNSPNFNYKRVSQGSNKMLLETSES